MSSVQTANVFSVEEIKTVLSNVEQQLHLEQTSRQSDKHWYRGLIEGMDTKQYDTAAQTKNMRKRLNERTVQIQEMLETKACMVNEITELKQNFS